MTSQQFEELGRTLWNGFKTCMSDEYNGAFCLELEADKGRVKFQVEVIEVHIGDTHWVAGEESDNDEV